jgi:hypothetical protein
MTTYVDTVTGDTKLSCAGFCGQLTDHCGVVCATACETYGDCSDYYLVCDTTKPATTTPTATVASFTSTHVITDVVIPLPTLIVTTESANIAVQNQVFGSEGISFSTLANVTSINQRQDFDYEFTIEGLYGVGEQSLSTPTGKRTQVSMIVRTPIIYQRSAFLVARVWMHGEVYGPFSSSTITLVLSDGFSQSTANCGSVSSYAGRKCAISISDEWFGNDTSTLSIYATMQNGDVHSNSVIVSLVPDNQFERPESVYMWLELPVFPLLPGSDFTVTLRACAQDDAGTLYALGTWVASISILQMITLTDVESSLYDISFSDGDTSISMVGTFKSAYSDNTEELSGEIVLATLTFTLSESLSTQTLENVFSLFIDDMVSTSSNKKVDDEEGMILSSIGYGDFGLLEIEEVSITGLLAYVGSGEEQELMNTAVLNGETVESSITMREVLSCHTVGSSSCAESSNFQTLSGDVNCMSGDSNVLGLSSQCNAQLTGLEISGSDRVNVTLVYGNFERQISFRVWYPISTFIEVTDSKLEQILSACSTPIFQEASVYVFGKWSCGPGCEETPIVDLTKYCVIESSNNDVIVVENKYAKAVGLGSSILYSLSGAEIEVVVSENITQPLQMHVVALNSIVFICV